MHAKECPRQLDSVCTCFEQCTLHCIILDCVSSSHSCTCFCLDTCHCLLEWALPLNRHCKARTDSFTPLVAGPHALPALNMIDNKVTERNSMPFTCQWSASAIQLVPAARLMNEHKVSQRDRTAVIVLSMLRTSQYICYHPNNKFSC